MLGQNRITFTDMSEFFSELALLLNHPVGLEDALQTLSTDQEKVALRGLVQNLLSGVSNGSSLADALSQQDDVPAFLVEQLRQAENRGEVPETLQDIADYYARLGFQNATLSGRTRFTLSLLYPLFLLLFTGTVVGMLLVFVIPVFAELFGSFGASLPQPTQWVIELSNAFSRFGWLLLALPFALWLIIFLEARQQGEQARLARYFSSLALALPGFGRVLQAQALGHCLLTWDFMLRRGSTPQSALSASAMMVDNRCYRHLLNTLAADWHDGQSLYEGLRRHPRQFPQKLLHRVGLYEKTGNLGELFTQSGMLYLETAQRYLEPSLRLFNFLLLLLIWGLIGFLVVAMYLPIFQMGEVI